MSALPKFQPHQSARELRGALARAELGEVISKKELGWLKALAAHPAADDALKQAIVDVFDTATLSESAMQKGGLAFADSLRGASFVDVRTDPGRALSEPFGPVEAELGSVPDALSSADLAGLLRTRWDDVKDGKRVSTAELAWLYRVATHPSSTGELREGLLARLQNRTFDAPDALVTRFLRGLAGEVHLEAAPGPRAAVDSDVASSIARPSFVLPDGLNAAELSQMIAEEARIFRKGFAPGETQVASDDYLAALVRAAHDPAADADVCRACGAALDGLKLTKDQRALAEVFARGERPRSLAAELSFITHLLSGASGDDGVLDQSELLTASASLSEAQSKAAAALFSSLADSAFVVSANELASFVPGDLLVAHPSAQLSAFAGVLANLGHSVDKDIRDQTRATFAGKTGEALKAAVKESAAGHLVLGYKLARELLFSRVANKDGLVDEVYGGRRIQARAIPEAEGPEGVNTEHTFPMSAGAEGTPAASDLHHLFPTDSEANSRRSSWPFGEVVDVIWQQGECKLGLDQFGNTVFEPPDDHKGNVARALAYTMSVYDLPFRGSERELLPKWSALDPVDDDERQRNERIERLQRNRNPFVDDPDLLMALLLPREV